MTPFCASVALSSVIKSVSASVPGSEVAVANMASSWSMELFCVATIDVLGTQLPMLVSCGPSVASTV